MPVVWSAVAFTISPILGGFINAMQTRKEVKGWYKTLKRPSWTPPDAAFGPVWTSLYAGKYTVVTSNGDLHYQLLGDMHPLKSGVR